MTYSSHAAFDVSGRLLKAKKIHHLIPRPPNSNTELRLLEIGTGSGVIAHYFSKLQFPQFRVDAVDVYDQRKIYEGFEFHVYDGQHLPFEDRSFDIVISNHVIEHVGQDAHSNHLAEICRMLAPDGYAYLATPSRWQIIEPHFGLPLLSWIPRSWRNSYVRSAGKGMEYDCYPLRPSELRRMLDACGLPYRSLNTQALRALIELEKPNNFWVRLASSLPDWRINKLQNFFPTLTYLIHNPLASDQPQELLD